MSRMDRFFFIPLMYAGILATLLMLADVIGKWGLFIVCASNGVGLVAVDLLARLYGRRSDG